jgi:hypothetical protein
VSGKTTLRAFHDSWPVGRSLTSSNIARCWVTTMLDCRNPSACRGLPALPARDLVGRVTPCAPFLADRHWRIAGIVRMRDICWKNSNVVGQALRLPSPPRAGGCARPTVLLVPTPPHLEIGGYFSVSFNNCNN